MSDWIKFPAIAFDKSERLVDHSDLYQFNTEGRLHWLQRLCFKILDFCGASYSQRIVEYEEFLLEADNIHDLIYEQRKNLARVLGISSGFELIIGSDDMFKLMSQCKHDGKYDVNSYIKYGVMRFNVTTDEFGMEQQEYCGMKVTVIPWMKGFILVPIDRKLMS